MREFARTREADIEVSRTDTNERAFAGLIVVMVLLAILFVTMLMARFQAPCTQSANTNCRITHIDGSQHEFGL